MDSKLRNKVIILVISIMMFTFGLVLYTNRDKLDNGQTSVAGEVTTTANGDSLSKEQLHAFLADETFFDSDTNIHGVSTGEADDLDNQLYLVVNSVERDIRVTIKDATGRAVKGISFFIKLDGDAEYKDLDQDGIIYIPDLSPGDYHVSLEAVDGYEVPLDATLVAVKPQLEFTPIEDISYLIYTEDMIDPTLEDTMVDYIDVEDVDASQHRDLVSVENGILGIDVSKWQKEIDWQKVKASGIEFAIIRCGYRGSQSSYLIEDPYFKANIEGARAAGIKVGVYFFTQATSDVEAVEEASMVLKLVEDYELDLPIFIDSESAGGKGRADGIDQEARTSVCKAFCQTIAGAGYNAGIYASRNWFYNRLKADELSEYYIWDAEYRDKPIYTGKYDIWQYTSSGGIDGINTRVDLNISYIDSIN